MTTTEAILSKIDVLKLTSKDSQHFAFERF